MSSPEVKTSLYSRQNRYHAKKALERSDIGEIPPVGDPSRREACRLDLFRFLTTYFPASTGLSPFSEDHNRMIEREQRCALSGGLFVNAMYRGSAKTTISENSAIWATMYGHRRFVPVFGADAGSADANIESIKLELSENDLLYADFPEVCHAIRALEGKPQRCKSQTYQGQLTHIEWTAGQIVFPHIPGSIASGAIIMARGITAATRGLKHKRPDGTQQRPDLLIIDDPQTDESAGTQIQVNKRLGIIKKTILKLGGHNRRIACVMNATVIQPNDVIEQLLDSSRNPAWQGERIKMVKRWADDHETLWLGEYTRLRNTYDPNIIGDQERAHAVATEFYKRNRDAMDKGCIVSWASCYDTEHEISAIQHAYNALIDDGPEVFASECQNEPIQPFADPDILKPIDIAAKTNGLERGVIPIGCEHVTAFIDVQGEVLYWLVAGWSGDFTGAVIDYGTYPSQDTAYFAMSSATNTLTKLNKGSGLEGRIYAGLETLVDMLVKREWKREDGAAFRISRCLIDANWGKSTATVNSFCRRSSHAALLMPSHGRYVGAASIPWEHYTKREGERLGFHWMVPSLRGKPSAVRHILIDTNYWKSFIHTRLAVALGDKGCLSLFGPRDDRQRGTLHQLLADHFSAEFRVKTEGRGRKVDEWKIKPGNPDNHWFDCAVGCAVAGSICGADLDPNRLQGRKVNLSDMRNRKRVTYIA